LLQTFVAKFSASLRRRVSSLARLGLAWPEARRGVDGIELQKDENFAKNQQRSSNVSSRFW
jgi:hypothetical protein